MPTLIITKGLPASGKTTYAVKWQSEKPLTRVRINRDDFREMMFGGWTGKREHEQAVTKASHSSVRALLRDGFHVIMDDTFLVPGNVTNVERIAEQCKARFEIVDFTHVSVDECILRDIERRARGERGVGEAVIRSLHSQFLAEIRI